VLHEDNKLIITQTSRSGIHSAVPDFRDACRLSFYI